MNVNWLDAVILLTFFWFAFTGLAAGLLRSGVTLLAFVFGIILAGLFYQRLSNDLRVMIADETVVRIVSLVVIFAATALAGQLIAILMKPLVAVFFFGPLDSVGGLVLGIFKAFIVLELVLVALVQFRSRSSLISDTLSHSLLAFYLLRNIPILGHFIPAAFRSAVDQFTNSFS
jgi:membrane protein required for colicin V production